MSYFSRNIKFNSDNIRSNLSRLKNLCFFANKKELSVNLKLFIYVYIYICQSIVNKILNSKKKEKTKNRTYYFLKR